jgi:hypothetical protein
VSARLYAGADAVDLVPGSLEALHADADDLDAAAARLGAAGRDIEHQVIASWFGLAAEGWPERRTTLVGGADGVAEVYVLAAQVLRAHADAVVWARLQAQVAVELWEEADRQSFMTADVCFAPARPRALAEAPRLGSGSGAALSPPTIVAPPDPGAATRDLARQVLESALRDVSRSATAAAEVLDALSEGLPDGRWHAGEFLAGIWSWLEAVGRLVIGISRLPSMLTRDDWYADAEAMRQDLLVTAEFLAANPDETGAVLFDSQGLRDNPARWWGAMAPDLALSAAYGVGVASRAATAFRVLPRGPRGGPVPSPPPAASPPTHLPPSRTPPPALPSAVPPPAPAPPVIEPAGAGLTKAPRVLTASEVRAVRSLSKEAAEHRAKLAAYKADPDAHDNLRLLANAPTAEVRQSIIEGRIRHLEREIATFERQIAQLQENGNA